MRGQFTIMLAEWQTGVASPHVLVVKTRARALRLAPAPASPGETPSHSRVRLQV